MTEKKKEIDKNLKSLIKNFQRREVITSHIDDKGQIVKDKYKSSPSDNIDEFESMDLLNIFNVAKPSSIYSKKIHDLRRNTEDDSYNHEASSKYYRHKKRKPSKVKRCRCK
jgi:hypothetical protein